MVGFNVRRITNISWVVAAVLLSSTPLSAANDTVPSGQRLTLQEAIDRALSKSPQVEKSQFALNAQVEKRRGSWLDLGPRINLEYNDVFFDDKQTTNFGGQEITLRNDRSQTGNITIAQPITGYIALVEKARYEGAQETMNEQTVKLTKAEVAYGAAEAYLRARQAEQLVEIAQSSVQAAESQLNDGKALERVGRMARGDVLRLELALSEARSRSAEARSGSDIAKASLKEVLAIDTRVPLTLDTEMPQVNLTALPSVDQVLSEAQNHRLEPKQAELGVTMAEFGKTLAYTRYTPLVNAFVKWDKTFGEPSGLGGNNDVVRSYGVQLKWDIGSFGTNAYGIREAAAGVAQAEAAQRAVQQQIRLDAHKALYRLQAAQEAFALAKVAVEQAEETYRIELARFRSGMRSASDLVLVEAARANARGRLVTAQTDLVVWNLNLQKAQGAEKPKL